MLTSFFIENFRTFRHLEFFELDQVNLIVGRNGVGKTTLLEALWLYAGKGHPNVIRQLTEMYGKYGRRGTFPEATLFHGCSSDPDSGEPIRLGPRNSPDAVLEIKLVTEREELALAVRTEGQPAYLFRPGRTYHWAMPSAEPPFVPARDISDLTVARWWSETALTDAEERVVECLRIVSPVCRVALTQRPESREWIAQARLDNESEPLALQELGSGAVRMFLMALAMETARQSGFLLIDEFENGIHYSVLPELWSFVLCTAQKLRVQVFASTHSRDCAEAFQQATVNGKGMLISIPQEEPEIPPIAGALS